MHRLLLAELEVRHIRVEPHEAVAIAQRLIDSGATAPTTKNVRLGDDGSVECAACDATPGTYELGIFLDSLAPAGRPGVPGGLRYTIARALHEVDAPPFDSIEELSAALKRFENGDSRAVVAQLMKRALGPARADRAGIREDVGAADVGAVLLAPMADERDGLSRPMHSAIAAPRRRRTSLVLGGVAAMVAFVVAGFLSVEKFYAVRRSEPRRHPAAVVALNRPTPTPTPSPTAAPATATPRPENSADLPPAVPAPRLRSAPAPAPRVEEPAPAFDDDNRSTLSPAFASNESATFAPNDARPDARPAAAASDANGYDLQVMTIVDDGARNFHVQPSPDGRSIAFDSDRDGERGIYLARRDGTDVHRVSGGGSAAMPTWSPDGRRLAYLRAEASNPAVWNLWLHSLDDGRETRVTSYRDGLMWAASWFPDGRRVGYAHRDTVVIDDLDTGREQVIAAPVKGRTVRAPAVSPDGTKIIFQVSREGAWLLNLTDGSLRCVLSDPTAEAFAWAPDGRRVAYHSRRDGVWGVYVIAG